ncbi:hypothetical protein C1S86_11370 [Vibrio parahaemolyticus]|uniref:hypothetical protein n=1 Tax=Vibrio parahaemolyticus TaxID=670 RepID=UPI0009928002|nr:hypothetical protein [Vibrio parahaemolyticus]OOQ70158.1 hypothetical protein BSR61_10240 [Vibrio parahaemolyticus]PMT76156.1 hypothetical protein C1S97_14315 [Vibrio parahaemolyticus]PMT81692.1 hypothetical protein C1S86_11370 [Vibrio parahaemolyticus]
MESIFTELVNLITSNDFLGSLFAILALVVAFLQGYNIRLHSKVKKRVADRILELDKTKKRYSPNSSNYKKVDAELRILEQISEQVVSSTTKSLLKFIQAPYTATTIFLSLESALDAKKKQTNTVVGMMLKERTNKANKSSLLLIAAIIVYLALSSITSIEFSWLVILIPSVLLFAFQADQYLITYRIRKGWYGRNEYEAREIIQYILAHADKDDFNDEGGLKKLMDAPEHIEEKATTDQKGWINA